MGKILDAEVRCMAGSERFRNLTLLSLLRVITMLAVSRKYQASQNGKCVGRKLCFLTFYYPFKSSHEPETFSGS